MVCGVVILFARKDTHECIVHAIAVCSIRRDRVVANITIGPVGQHWVRHLMALLSCISERRKDAAIVRSGHTGAAARDLDSASREEDCEDDRKQCNTHLYAHERGSRVACQGRERICCEVWREIIMRRSFLLSRGEGFSFYTQKSYTEIHKQNAMREL